MKTILSLFFVLFSAMAVCQEPSETGAVGKNEIRLNVLYLVLAYPEVSYEYNISEETSIGASFAFSLDEDNVYDFHFIPYYRFYFGKKYAAGFLIELHTGIYNQESNIWTSNGTHEEKYIGFQAGFSLGFKLLTKSGITGELALGVGRNFANTDFIDQIYPRGSISIGRRF